MNHVYRVVFNRSLGVYQCVSELAKSRGKSGSGKSQTAIKLLLTPLAIAMLGLSGTAMAVTYDNGQTTTPNVDPYFVTDDTVTGNNTILKVNKLYLSNQPTPSKMNITNKGEVDAQVTLLTNEATLNVNSAKLTSNQLAVGYEGSGTLTATKGAIISATQGVDIGSGNNADGNGVMTLSGLGTELNSPAIEVGNAGNGQLSLSDGATLQSDQTVLGRGSSGNGELTLDGTTGVVDDLFIVGLDGTGTLNIQNAAQLTGMKEGFSVGNQSLSKDNVVNVKGKNSQLKVDGLLQVGDLGEGTLNVTEGASVNSQDSIIFGRLEGSHGIANIDGVGSKVNTVQNAIVIGKSGTGKLTVTNKGSINSQLLYIAGDAIGKGQMTASDAETKVDTSELIVGFGGDGNLAVENKAVVNTDDLYIGYGTEATGITTIDKQGVINVANTMGVGVSGTGKLQLTNNATLNVDGNLVTGNKIGSKGNTITVGSSDETDYINNNINVKDQIQIGDLTDGTLDIINGTVRSEGNFIIGHKEGAEGNVILNGPPTRIGSGSGMAVGLAGKGTLDIKNGGGVSVNDLMVVGDAVTGIGTVNFDGGSNTNGNNIETNRLIVGAKGQGVMNIKNTYDLADTAWSIGLDVNQDIIIGDDTTGLGQLTVDSSLASANNIIVGNKGSGTLKVVNNGFLGASNISRGIDSILSDVYFDNATLNIGAQPNLFANFTDEQPINIGSGGLKFEVNENITINPNAVLTGSVGSVDLKNGKGGFIKKRSFSS